MFAWFCHAKLHANQQSSKHAALKRKELRLQQLPSPSTRQAVKEKPFGFAELEVLLSSH